MILKGLVNLPNSREGRDKDKKNAVKDIAAASKKLMMFNELRADVKITAALHTHFVFPHFQFLQEGNPLTGNVAGYQGRLQKEWYFLMHNDLHVCKDEGWRNEETFKGLVSFMDEVDDNGIKENIN